MKVIETKEATATLAEYAAEIGSGPVINTDAGQPVAVLVSIEGADLETISLSTNREFMELIECSRSLAQVEGSVPSGQMRRRFE